MNRIVLFFIVLIAGFSASNLSAQCTPLGSSFGAMTPACNGFSGNYATAPLAIVISPKLMA
ncbi:MAG: hypothetical protein H6579_00110 [Chitinophagales bacterium]|nr:hypothetical protein [Chitinophagales bacterium]